LSAMVLRRGPRMVAGVAAVLLAFQPRANAWGGHCCPVAPRSCSRTTTGQRSGGGAERALHMCAGGLAQDGMKGESGTPSARKTIGKAKAAHIPSARHVWDASVSLESLRERQAAFAKERTWDQHHTPRNLALAMVGEVGTPTPPVLSSQRHPPPAALTAGANTMGRWASCASASSGAQMSRRKWGCRGGVTRVRSHSRAIRTLATAPCACCYR